MMISKLRQSSDHSFIPAAAVLFALILTALLAVPRQAFGYDAASHACELAADDITSAYEISLRTQAGGSSVAADVCDGSVSTGSTAGEGRYWQLAASAGAQDAGGIYLLWERAPGPWRLTYSTDGESFSGELLCGRNGFIEEYVPLPDGVRAVRLEPLSCELALLEVSVWTRGRLPDSVHDWDVTPSECELMLISAHQDDELLFFGGMIPLYAGEKMLDTVVVYMADCGSLRLHEALDGLWTCGMRQYPVFLMLPDVKSQSLQQARKTWDEAVVSDTLAALFLRYRPQVVVTHDVNGEYGHGQHRLTAQCVRQALLLSEDAASAARITGGGDTYSVPKCYLHLWRKNEVFIDWNEIYLDKMQMTAAEAASLGYECHVSQHKSYRQIFINGSYDCRSFGLYRSGVGDDSGANDIFENITLRIAAPDTPPIPLNEDMVRRSYSGFVYSLSPDSDEYARFGNIGGSDGWFRCRADGALLYDDHGDAVPVGNDTQQPEGAPVLSASDVVQEYMPTFGDKLRYILFPDGHVSGYATAAVTAVVLIIIFAALRKRKKRKGN